MALPLLNLVTEALCWLMWFAVALRLLKPVTDTLRLLSWFAVALLLLMWLEGALCWHILVTEALLQHRWSYRSFQFIWMGFTGFTFTI